MGGGSMDVAKRIKLSRIVDKIERNKIYANRIGTSNKSELKTNKTIEVGGTRR